MIKHWELEVLEAEGIAAADYSTHSSGPLHEFANSIILIMATNSMLLNVKGV